MRRSASRLALLLAILVIGVEVTAESAPLRLATTTSTESSGLLGFLLPTFEKSTGTKVHVIGVGSGKAIKLGENGDVDVILSHAPSLEERFIAQGWGVDRKSVMYNDFVIVGPPDDPAGVAAAKTTTEALSMIANAGVDFISRGDISGTHLKEMALWETAGIEPAGKWYVSAGLGMGPILLMASERGGYTLTDRGTFLAYRAKTDLSIRFQGDPPLHNPYTIMAVSSARHEHANYSGARALIAWITGPEAQEMIGNYQVDGQTLFFPDADPVEVRDPAL